MKTYLLTFGRGTGDPVAGMLKTLDLNAWLWVSLGEMYRELVTVLDNKFALQFHTKNGNAYTTFSVEDDVADAFIAMLYTALSCGFGNAELKLVPDFVDEITSDMEVASTEFIQTKNFIYPVHTGADFMTDSLQPLVEGISKLPAEDSIIVQFVARPIKDDALLHMRFGVNRSIQKVLRRINPKYWFKKDIVSEGDKSIEGRITAKSKLEMYYVTIRFAAYKQCSGGEREKQRIRKYLKSNLATLVGGYGQFFEPDINILKPTPVYYGEPVVRRLKNRSFYHRMIFSTLELSSLWHPTEAFSTVKNLVIHKSVPPEIPRNSRWETVPTFGRSNYRDCSIEFGFSREALRKHLYVIGKSGTGKSFLLQLLIRNDMRQGHGLAVIDPHGDLVDNVLRLVPKERVNDVIILDPSDRDFPVVFNPLAWVPEKQRLQVALGVVETFRKLLSNVWNDQLELLIRYIAGALISTRDATMLSVEKLINDEDYRIEVAGDVDDDGIRNFWLHEYDAWAEQHQGDVIAPLLEGMAQFLAADTIRNIVVQPGNKFDFRSIIDSNKILLVKVSKGLLGDENAALLGSLVMNKLYQAAMSRADIPENLRKDFYFYVDEFQTFATENIKSMLAESRKYRLNLILAHQVLGQIPGNVAQTIFGNVGNIVAFCLSAEDAGTLSNELSSEADPVSLTNLPVRDFFVKMLVNDKVIRPFSGRTIDLVYPKENYTEECKAISRSQYAVPLRQAQQAIAEWEKGSKSRKASYAEAKLDLRLHLRRHNTVLELSNLEISDEHLLQLSHTAFDNVRELVLSNTNITDKGLVCIANLHNLVKLALDDTAVSDNGLKALVMLPRLRRLNLSATQVTDAGLQLLRSSHIHELLLRRTAISDKGLAALIGFGELTEVALEGSAVTANGVEKLKLQMPRTDIHAF